MHSIKMIPSARNLIAGRDLSLTGYKFKKLVDSSSMNTDAPLTLDAQGAKLRKQERLFTDDLLITTTQEKREPQPPLEDTLFPTMTESYQVETVKVPPTEAPVPPYSMPFAEVPGPWIFKTINRMWSYLPLVGTQTAASLLQWSHRTIIASARVKLPRNLRPYNFLFNHYGPVVKLHGLFGGNIVMLNRPEHIQEVYRQDNRKPVEATLDSLEMYRKHRSLTSFPSANYDVTRLRERFKDNLVHYSEQFHPMMDTLADELINRMYVIRNIQDEMPDYFTKELYKWGLECASRSMFNKQIGFMEPSGQGNATEASRMLSALLSASEGLSDCESNIQLWRIANTRSWKKLVTSCDILEGLLCRNMRSAYMRLEKLDKSETSDTEPLAFLESMIIKDNLTAEETLTLLLDVLLIGVNTTVNSTAFLLYHLARSPRVQKKLHEQITAVLPSKDAKLHTRDILKIDYLKACILESLRLKPPFPFITRRLEKDIVIYGYSIPKGTYVVLANEIACHKEEDYENAEMFLPERWLNESCPKLDLLAASPYSRGHESLSKKLTYQQMSILTAKLVCQFKMEYYYGPINAYGRILAIPNKPFKIRFTNRVD